MGDLEYYLITNIVFLSFMILKTCRVSTEKSFLISSFPEFQLIYGRYHNSTAECNKVVTFLANLSFYEISKCGFIRTFCTIFENDNPFSFRNIKGALDNFSLIPIFFFKKVEIFISLEVYTYVVTAC